MQPLREQLERARAYGYAAQRSAQTALHRVDLALGALQRARDALQLILGVHPASRHNCHAQPRCLECTAYRAMGEVLR